MAAPVRSLRARGLILGLSLAKLAVAAVASFMLFVVVSYLHGFVDQQIQSVVPQKRMVVTELIKEKPKEEKQAQQRIRQVQTSREAGGRSSGGKMDMRFAPDLAVDAGPGSGDGVELGGQELSAEVFEEGQTDEPAQEAQSPPLTFPDRAREMGISGTVKVRFTVTYQGKASSIEILSSPSPLFSDAVRRNLAESKYRPAKNKGVPVNQRVTKSFEFNVE